MKYDIVEEYSTHMLKQVVKEFIELGWKPLGGMCIDDWEDGKLYCQVIVKENKDD